MTPEPSEKCRRLLEFFEFQISEYKGFLGCVFRQMLVTQQCVGIPHRHVLEAAYQITIRFSSACTNSLDQRGQIFHIVSP